MDMIAAAREIGKALQQDERYLRATADAETVNNSEELRRMVEEFEQLRNRMEQAAGEDPVNNADLLKELDGQMRAQYDAINAHPLMAQYTASRNELERFVNYMMRIITGAANGEDPEQIQEPIDCTGSCSTCGGCH